MKTGPFILSVYTPHPWVKHAKGRVDIKLGQAIRVCGLDKSLNEVTGGDTIAEVAAKMGGMCGIIIIVIGGVRLVENEGWCGAGLAA
jgi:hypothetical protein